jgi:fucose 4-O-acetylase-like acetyltransferase
MSFLAIHGQILSRIQRMWVQALIMTMGLVAGVYLMRALWLWRPPFQASLADPFSNGIKGFPWSADLILVCLFYYYLGFKYRSENIELGSSSKILCFLSIFLFVICHILFPHIADLNLRRYDDLAVNTLEAMSGIVIVICLARLADSSKYDRMKKCLVYVGRLSLVILIFHLYIQGKTYSVSARLLPFNDYVAYVISLLAGVVGPILLYEIVLKRTPILRKIYVRSGGL